MDPSSDRIVEVLLERHGRTYADEAGIDIDRNTPAPLFQLLCLALLLSARIRADAAVSASRALRDAGWTTADHLAASTWEERTKVLNESGYARYDERTARMLGATVDLLCDRYGGDLRRLRSKGDPSTQRDRLQDFSGIGPLGADIFCREVQRVWTEHHPFVDARAAASAQRLGLGEEAEQLARFANDPADFTVLVAALVRCGLAGDHDEILAAAS